MVRLRTMMVKSDIFNTFNYINYLAFTVNGKTLHGILSRSGIFFSIFGGNYHENEV